MIFFLAFDDGQIVGNQCGRGKDATPAATFAFCIIGDKSQILRTNYFERD
jgi:hypothetical protein